MNKDLTDAGAIAVMRNNTEETRKLRLTIWTIFFIILSLICFGIYWVKANHIIAYPVEQLRQIAGKC